MKFLISTNVSEFRHVLGNQSSQVLFSQDNAQLASQISGVNTIDVWICSGDEVTEELMNQWLDHHRTSPKTLLVHEAKHIPLLENISRGRVAEIQATSKQERGDSSWAVSTLRAAERLYARAYARGAAHYSKEVTALEQRSKESVLIVGAGIMSLVAGEVLATSGYRVRIVDAGPDPRTCNDWTRLGVTHGGGDARMFTFTEADNYNERGSDIYHDMRHVFRKTTQNGGWSVKPPSTFSAAETAWVNSFEQLPTWLAQAMKEDIYYVNSQASKLWDEYMERAPTLFQDVLLHADILRLYVEEVALTAAHGLNRDLGSFLGTYSNPELLEKYPSFEQAVEINELAGGFTVQGFTLGIHSFSNKLIEKIIEHDGEFVWNCNVEKIQRNAFGEVTLLESQLGPLQADHFVISTGVTRNALLDGTASENLVHGVLGVWLRIPNLDPKITNSIKIHRRGCLVEDINVTVSKDPKTGEDILIFGGGYGYVGLDYPSPDSPELQALFQELEVVAQIYFPEAHRRAKEQGTLWPNEQQKFCIRPFTSTGLGIFEDIPTASGGHLIITGGNNTGGFAQAPAIARAVSRALEGEYDPIHVLFNPHRSKLISQFSTPDIANEAEFATFNSQAGPALAQSKL